MNTKKNDLYLIDSYVEEVGKHLPARQREDIKAEIRSLLNDNLEDRVRETGQELDVDMVADLLKEFGPPEEMAASYIPNRYLIGPKMFPLFWLVLKIVMIVLCAVALVGSGIRLSQAPDLNEGLRVVGKSMLELLGGLMSAFANIVIVFAILERFLPEHELRNNQDWDPRKLHRVTDQDKTNPVGHIIGMVFASAFIVLINFFPQYISGVYFEDGTSVTSIIRISNFARYFPWITTLLAMEIIFSINMLWRGAWGPATRWTRIGLDALGLALMAVMIFGGPLIDLPTVIPGLDADVQELANNGLRIALGIALFCDGISIIETLVKIFKKKPLEFPVA